MDEELEQARKDLAEAKINYLRSLAYMFAHGDDLNAKVNMDYIHAHEDLNQAECRVTRLEHEIFNVMVEDLT